MESEGDWVTSTVTGLEPALIVPPEGEVPAAVAVSAMDPLSMSAWVTVYVPVKIAVWSGSKVVVAPEQVPVGVLRL